MTTVEGIKATLIQAAYTGAVAVCEPLISNPDGTLVKLDPLIQDVGLQQKDLLVYEVAKIHYHAILRAFHDKTGIWPDPVIATQPKPASPASGAGGPASVVSDVAKVVSGVASAIAPTAPGAELVAGVANALAGTTQSQPAK